MTQSNVVPLFPDDCPSPETSDVLLLLEAMIRDARSGRLTGFAFIGTVAEGGFVSEAAGRMQDPLLTLRMLPALGQKTVERVSQAAERMSDLTILQMLPALGHKTVARAGIPARNAGSRRVHSK